MHRTLRTLAALLILPFAAGCVESTTLLKIGKDGSGTVTVREYYSPQLTQMMEGMAGMMGAEATGEDGAATPPPKTNLFKDNIEKKAAQLGPDVKITHQEEVTNEEGWKGYLAVYAFEDIRKLNLGIGDSEPGEDGEEEDGNAAFRFAFTPGSPAKLEIIPKKPPAAAEEPATAEDAGGADAMGEQMGAMMAGMLKGMRLTFLVQVDGTLKETNARYSIPGRNTIVVMDLPVDKLMGNPQALKLMSSKDPSTQKKLLDMNIEGVKLEEPNKTISLTFE